MKKDKRYDKLLNVFFKSGQAVNHIGYCMKTNNPFDNRQGRWIGVTEISPRISKDKIPQKGFMPYDSLSKKNFRIYASKKQAFNKAFYLAKKRRTRKEGYGKFKKTNLLKREMFEEKITFP